MSQQKILIYFDCLLSIICAHLFFILHSLPLFVASNANGNWGKINQQFSGIYFHWLFVLLYFYYSHLSLSHFRSHLMEFGADVNNFLTIALPLQSWQRARALNDSFFLFGFLSSPSTNYETIFSWIFLTFASFPSLRLIQASENNFFNSQMNWHRCQVLLE